MAIVLDISVLIIGIVFIGIGAILYAVGNRMTNKTQRDVLEIGGIITAIIGIIIVVFSLIGPLQAGLLTLGG